jgi:hypothetical protein
MSRVSIETRRFFPGVRATVSARVAVHQEMHARSPEVLEHRRRVDGFDRRRLDVHETRITLSIKV